MKSDYLDSRLVSAKEEAFASLRHYVKDVYPVDIDFIRECSDVHYSICCRLGKDIVNEFKKKQKEKYNLGSISDEVADTDYKLGW